MIVEKFTSFRIVKWLWAGGFMNSGLIFHEVGDSTNERLDAN